MDLGLENKVALVTGGTKGIGKAIAKALADEGAQVVICGRGKDNLEKTKKDIESSGKNVLAIQADLTKQADVDHLISTIIETHNTIDILINNAGMTPGFNHFENITLEDWENIFDLNVFGTVRVTKAVLPYMKKANYGRIINLGSESGVQPDAFMPEYNATKAALINLTKSLSKAYAKDGILINTVSPAFVMTPLLENAMQQDAEKQGISFDKAVHQFLEENRPHIEVKRPGNPEEVASSVVYLASDKSSFINGANIRVDGGSVASQ